MGATSGTAVTVADATLTTIFQSDRDAGATADGPGLMEVIFEVDSASAAPLKVFCKGVHNTGDYAVIRAGKSKSFFRRNDPDCNGISKIIVQGFGGTATYDWTVTAR